MLGSPLWKPFLILAAWLLWLTTSAASVVQCSLLHHRLACSGIGCWDENPTPQLSSRRSQAIAVDASLTQHWHILCCVAKQQLLVLSYLGSCCVAPLGEALLAKHMLLHVCTPIKPCTQCIRCDSALVPTIVAMAMSTPHSVLTWDFYLSHSAPTTTHDCSCMQSRRQRYNL